MKKRNLIKAGYREERSQVLNANHRGVCKFKDEYDSNYLTLKSALVLTVDSIKNNGTKQH